MKKGLTELVFILDRSGSMAGLEKDTIGGYNSLLKKQKLEEGEARITTVLFDDMYELLHNRKDIREIKPISEREYYVRGCTALLDAIGKTIHKLGKIQKNLPETERAEHVLFVITTDGMENASKKYSYQKIKEMVKHQKKKYGWEFIFLGANMDAIATAAQFGIESNRASNYHADVNGIQLSYHVIGETVSKLRANLGVSDNWKDSIEEDYNKRGHEK